MCSSPHWQVGLSWFREKLSPANREQRLSRWADFAKNCLPRIGSKELPRFCEKYRALGRQKMGSNMRPRYIQFRDIRDRDISGLHCNGLSPDRRQAIIWTNAGLLSIGPLRTYFIENLIKIQQFSLKKMHVKMLSAKWRPSCLGLNVLKAHTYQWYHRLGSCICRQSFLV